MPSDKPKVVSYLDDAQKAVFDKLCKEKGFTNSQGVAHLINEQLVTPQGAQKALAVWGDCEDRIAALEQSDADYEIRVTENTRTVERQQEQIGELQRTVEKLEQLVHGNHKREFTDQEIADIVRVPVEKVALWRKGVLAPRGWRVCERLKPYRVVHGQWVLRDWLA